MEPLIRFTRSRFFALVLTLLLSPATLSAEPQSARDLEGLWAARLRFGPDIRGSLRVEHQPAGWRAEIAGLDANASLEKDLFTFALPNGAGSFRGHFDKSRQRISGHWIQLPTANSGGRYASPVTLERVGKSERWEGVVDPLDDQFTMYLKVDAAPDGSMRAFIKNPERNQGYFMRIATLERDGAVVRLRAKRSAKGEGEIVSEGRFEVEDGVLSLPLRGGTYDFQRVEPASSSDFYPRSRPGTGSSYHYRVPPAFDDGWPVAKPEDVGLSREKLETFVRTLIDAPMDSLSTMQTHSVLIARHGKLVLEEYFHGEHRDKPHDTRSAAKSVMAVVAGAAIQSGLPLRADSPVYEVMNGGKFPDGLEPGKRALTLEHLLTMSSGLDADDNDENSRGAEDRVDEEGVADVWAYTLALDMVRAPGDTAIYASLQPNLAGGVVRAAAGRPLYEVFHDLVAEPMQIRRYWMNLMETGEPYMGGGTRLLSRDFMKFGQLMLNDGTWGKRRVISAAWAQRSRAPLVEIGRKRRSKYGYLWWLIEYPYQGRILEGFYAGGNGGQVVVGMPDLDLVIAFTGGSYADPVMFDIQRRYIPELVLPAVIGK